MLIYLQSNGSAGRESNVVDSEFKVNLHSDQNILSHLLSLLSDVGHPFSRFTAGNNQSLRDNHLVDVQAEIEKFRKSYYSSNSMKLVVLTNEFLEDIEKYILPF